jgi:hypothetical protein
MKTGAYPEAYPEVHSIAIRSVEEGRLIILPIVPGSLVLTKSYDILRGRLDDGEYTATLATEEGDGIVVPARSIAFLLTAGGRVSK